MKTKSYAQTLKEELSARLAQEESGLYAELAGLVNGGAKIATQPLVLTFSTDTEAVADKFLLLVKKLFAVSAQKTRVHGKCVVSLEDAPTISQLLMQLGLWGDNAPLHVVPQELLNDTADMQAYFRGLFLGCGLMADPVKQYTCELIDDDENFLQDVALLGAEFDLDMRMRKRSDKYVLSIKDSEQVVDFLSVVQAYTALMNLENIRIEKDMRNQINRSVNCEAANLNKQVKASLKQIDEIRYVLANTKKELPEGLKEMAKIRIAYPEEALSELGEHFDPPIGRSGVNHRLRRLSEIYRQMVERVEKEGQEK